MTNVWVKFARMSHDKDTFTHTNAQNVHKLSCSGEKNNNFLSKSLKKRTNLQKKSGTEVS